MASSRSRQSRASKVRKGAQRVPKLRGRTPTADSDASRVVFVDELWTVELKRSVNGRYWSWILSFPSLVCGHLWADDYEVPLTTRAAALADVRRALRRILGAST